MTSTLFAIALKPDSLLGFVPLPYLLKKQTHENFYRTFKQLTLYDYQIDIIPKEEWIKDIIRIYEQLKPEHLNARFNKKKKKLNFEQFFRQEEKSVQKYILQELNKLISPIYNEIIHHKPLVFYKESSPSHVYKEDIISVSKESAQVKFFFSSQQDTLEYSLKTYYRNHEISLLHPSVVILHQIPAIFIHKNFIYWIDEEDFNGMKLKPFLNKTEISIPKKLQSDYFNKFIKPAVRKFDYEINGFDMQEQKVQKEAFLLIEQGFSGDFLLTPLFKYGIKKVPFYQDQSVFVEVIEQNGQFTLHSISRDKKYEEKLLEGLKNTGLIAQEKYYQLPNKSANKYDFLSLFSAYIKKIEKLGFQIENHVFKQEISFDKPEISHHISQEQDWFDLKIIIKVGEFKIPFKKLKKNILEKNPEYLLPDKKLFIIPNSWFAELYPFAERLQPNNLSRFHKTHSPLLLQNKLIVADKEILQSYINIQEPKKISVPEAINAQLRDYQKTGFQWLHHLSLHGFGVCLADDMGLGKTLQVIALLQQYYKDKTALSPKNKIPNSQLSIFDNIADDFAEEESTSFLSTLLIVPRSLIFNWVEELKKFAPKLNYHIYYGHKRQEELEANIHQKHLLITTYGVVRKDIDFLKEQEFSFLVLDESQAIKNPKSLNYKSVTQLEAHARISITGTPFENKLQDIWAQMNFLNHGMLGNLSYFENTYAKPLEQDDMALQTQELQLIIRPFILRRLKQDVAKELPEKIEQTVFCDMSDAQEELYEEEKSAVRNVLLFEKNKKNFVQKLAVLNRLRQIALHPKMIMPDSNIASGKFESITQTMDSLIEQGAKFLVFSSFVKHLALLEEYLQEKEIKYSKLTGKDKNRQQIVQEYQEDPHVLPFLISIKAGGVGLNITSATYVLLIDPWWNPFVEQQAIDRTHRIGQSQKVNIYKFITKNTIEEKIVQLQNSKLLMNENLINAAAHNSLKLTDLEHLLD
ncbi:MAG: hypothetical protein B7C24_05610 [Bacteroidetes bacterium 4572_77]|nr:MAG: hypothetical protein B7C24_05610 [Bacteroidetes bacterium 4572_77]